MKNYLNNISKTVNPPKTTIKVKSKNRRNFSILL